jgi:hypothetical protein
MADDTARMSWVPDARDASQGPREPTLEHRELKAIKYQTVWLELEEYVGHDMVLV